MVTTIRPIAPDAHPFKESEKRPLFFVLSDLNRDEMHSQGVEIRCADEALLREREDQTMPQHHLHAHYAQKARAVMCTCGGGAGALRQGCVRIAGQSLSG